MAGVPGTYAVLQDATEEPQVERVMKINELSTITDDVIEAARSTLVIGIS